MARARLLKPGFFANEQLASIAPIGRLLFAGLWTLADREGRLPDRPRWIKGALFPYENPPVDKLLDQLSECGFIQRYEVDGDRFIQVSKFEKHQHVHIKEQASTIPAPDLHGASTAFSQPDPSEASTTSTSTSTATTRRGVAAPFSATEFAEQQAEQPLVFNLYRELFGLKYVNELVATELRDVEENWTEECIRHCFQEAAGAHARTWNLVKKILNDHKKDGCNGRSAPANNRAITAEPQDAYSVYGKPKPELILDVD